MSSSSSNSNPKADTNSGSGSGTTSSSSSNAKPTIATMNDMLKIVCVFLSRPESGPFREPVNWKQLGLVDYLKIVKKPMDLGTVKRKIEAGEYGTNGWESIEACAADIRLVWTNCMKYNQDGSDFYHLALLFAKKFDEVFAQLRKLNKGQGGEDKGKDKDKAAAATVTELDKNRVPTLEERMALSYDVFRLANLEMGRVITAIEAAAPAALSFKAGAADEVIINFDMLPPAVFHDIAAMIAGFIATRKAQAKAAAAAGGGGKKKRALEEASVAGDAKLHKADGKK